MSRANILDQHEQLILEMQETHSCDQIADFLSFEFGIAFDACRIYDYIKSKGVVKTRVKQTKKNYVVSVKRSGVLAMGNPYMRIDGTLEGRPNSNKAKRRARHHT